MPDTEKQDRFAASTIIIYVTLTLDFKGQKQCIN